MTISKVDPCRRESASVAEVQVLMVNSPVRSRKRFAISRKSGSSSTYSIEIMVII
jgi:hypothetical protein